MSGAGIVVAALLAAGRALYPEPAPPRQRLRKWPAGAQPAGVAAGPVVSLRLQHSGARVELPEGWSAAGPDARGADVVGDASGVRIAVEQVPGGCGPRVEDAAARGEPVEPLPWAEAGWHPRVLPKDGGYLVCSALGEDARSKRSAHVDVALHVALPPGRALDAALLEVLAPLRDAVASAEPLPDKLWFGGVELKTAALRGTWFLHRKLMPRTLERDVAGGVVQAWAAKRGEKCVDAVERPAWVPAAYHVTAQGFDDAAWLDVCTALPGRAGATAHYRLAARTMSPEDLDAAQALLDAILRAAREAPGVAGAPGTRAEFE